MGHKWWQKGAAFLVTYLVGFVGFSIVGAIVIIALMTLGILPAI